jgi:hypothetical protein
VTLVSDEFRNLALLKFFDLNLKLSKLRQCQVEALQLCSKITRRHAYKPRKLFGINLQQIGNRPLCRTRAPFLLVKGTKKVLTEDGDVWALARTSSSVCVIIQFAATLETRRSSVIQFACDAPGWM